MAKNFAKVTPEDYRKKRKNIFYRTFVGLVLFPIVMICQRIKVYGKENIPKSQSFIIASNHISYFDPPIVSIATGLKVAFMAKKELFEVPILNTFIDWLGAFAVNREKLEVSTIKSAKNVLKTDWSLGIFPQGTRIEVGKIGVINPGFAYFAKSAKADIIPVGITGAEKCPGKAIIRIGKPISHEFEIEELTQKWGEAISELTGFEFDCNNENSSSEEESLA